MSNSPANSLAKADFPAAIGPSTTTTCNQPETINTKPHIHFIIPPTLVFSSNRLVVDLNRTSLHACNAEYSFSRYGNGAGLLSFEPRIVLPEMLHELIVSGPHTRDSRIGFTGVDRFRKRTPTRNTPDIVMLQKRALCYEWELRKQTRRQIHGHQSR